MDAPTACHVSGALAAVLRASRYVGVAPLRFVKKDAGWRVSLASGWTVLYGYILFTITSVMVAGNLFFNWYIRVNHNISVYKLCDNVVWVINSCYPIVLAATAAFGAPAQMRSMIACLNHVHKINNKLNVHHEPIFSDRKKIFLFTLVAVVTIALGCAEFGLQLIITAAMEDEIWLSLLFWFYAFCYSMINLRIAQFIALSAQVMEVFKTINDELRSLQRDVTGPTKAPPLLAFNKRSNKVNKKEKRNNAVTCFPDFRVTNSDGISVTRPPHHETVRGLSRAYTRACDVVREVDRSHGPVLLLTLGLLLMELVILSYFFITNSTFTQENNAVGRPPQKIWLFRAILHLFWCFYWAAYLVIIIEPCHLTQVEMETTKELLGHLMRSTYSSYDLLGMELEQFFKHLVLNEASYSPLQVTKLSRSLYISILGSVTTYLVILVEP